MKAKVRLSYEVTLCVEGKSEEEISEWLTATTPEEAFQQARKNDMWVSENFEEEIIRFVDDDYPADVVLGDKEEREGVLVD